MHPGPHKPHLSLYRNLQSVYLRAPALPPMKESLQDQMSDLWNVVLWWAHRCCKVSPLHSVAGPVLKLSSHLLCSTLSHRRRTSNIESLCGLREHGDLLPQGLVLHLHSCEYWSDVPPGISWEHLVGEKRGLRMGPSHPHDKSFLGDSTCGTRLAWQFANAY